MLKDDFIPVLVHWSSAVLIQRALLELKPSNFNDLLSVDFDNKKSL